MLFTSSIKIMYFEINLTFIESYIIIIGNIYLLYDILLNFVNNFTMEYVHLS